MPDEVGNVSKSRSALINSRRASWKSVEPVGKSEEDGHREKSIAWARIYALLRKEKKKKLYRLKKNKKEKETKRCKNNLDTRERAIRVRRGGLSDKCVLWVMKSRWGAFVPSTTTYWSCISVYTLTRFQRSDRENRGNEGDGKRMTGDRQTDRGNTGRRNLSCENTNGYINATWKDIRSRERTGRIVDNTSDRWDRIRLFKNESQLFRSFKSLNL